MKRISVRHIALILLFFVGLGVLFYPTLSSKWNERVTSRAIQQYDEAVDEIDNSEKEKILEDARAYNATLIGGQVPDAFLMTDYTPNPIYQNMLDPTGTGYMGSVEIPAINIKIPIYHYTTPEILEKGAGHLPGSSLPVGGESTHTVISAHRGLPSAKLFTDLDRLKEGNRFFLHVLDEDLAYEVDQILVVEPNQTEDLGIEVGKDYCTLLTCTPYGVNSHRMLVRGHRVMPFTEEMIEDESVAKAAPPVKQVLMRVLCVVAGIVIALLIVFIIDRRNRRNRRRGGKKA